MSKNTESQLLEHILKEIVLNPIKVSVTPLQNSINNLIEDMKFLFKDDEVKTKKVFLENCFDETINGNQHITPIRNAIDKLAEDFKFLFEHDKEMTKTVLIKACFDVNLEENQIDTEYFIASIPETTKNMIYEKAIPKIMELFKVDDLR